MGVSEEQIADLARYRESEAFSPLERLVLDLAVGMSETPAAVAEELVTELGKHFDEPQIVELTAYIAWENFRARFNCALGVTAHGFSEGAVCALPER